MPLRLLLTALLICVAGLMSGSAVAILGGQPDGNGHPYVGYADNGSVACSGTLLSPTVMLTAAHCFSDTSSVDGNNTVTGAPLVRVSFDPNLVNTNPSDRVWHFGTYYFDPGIVNGGTPLDTHDIAVIVFTPEGCGVPQGATGISSCGPIPGSATNGQYGALPTEGLVDTLANNAEVDLVGYGVQDIVRGGGPCGGPCKPGAGDSATRFYGQTTLIAGNDKTSSTLLKLHSNASAFCFGDSGGPDLLSGTNIVLGINSFVANDVCAGNAYSYRADTAGALKWVHDTVAAHGAGL